ncbi:MAG: histidine ammonia-lyase [Planctomycetes bacterium]|nr:histidine ammonia-lyase [Planctomycetota bacterium]
MTKTLVLDGSRFRFQDAWRILSGETERLRLSPAAWRRVERSRAVVDRLAASGRTVYGVNTGFGKFQDVVIPREGLGRLQLNLLRSHAAGVGPPLSPWEVRLALALRANTLARGHSGVSPAVLRALLRLFGSGVLPVVPSQGSVGASGDLAPLAHLALVLVGEGEATFGGRRMGGGEALAKAGLAPVRLGPKDALALINGTQVTNALGLSALVFADALAVAADVAAAMSVEALRGSARPFLSRVQEVRPHPGQAASAANLRRLFRGSRTFASHAKPHGKVQDPYSLRCVPQVHGASRDVLGFALGTALREANASTDNPLVFPGEEEETVSAGNFHAQPLALAFDAAAMAAAELASISERRIEQMVNPDLSGGLPPFLARQGGLESGMMIVQVTAAALVSENKILCHPASVDSIPTSGNQEDHVSMGTTAARKLGQVVANAEHVLAAELLCAAEALDARGGPAPGRGVEAARACVRGWVERFDGDEPPSPALRSLAMAIRSGSVGAAAAKAAGPLAGLREGA